MLFLWVDLDETPPLFLVNFIPLFTNMFSWVCPCARCGDFLAGVDGREEPFAPVKVSPPEGVEELGFHQGSFNSFLTVVHSTI